MSSLEEIIRSCCSREDVQKYLEAIFNIVKEKKEQIEEIEKTQDFEKICSVLQQYNNETHHYIFELQSFLSITQNKEENMSLLDKYEKLEELLFKIKTIIMKTPESITDMKEDILKIQGCIVDNLATYDKKVPDEQKERFYKEIEQYDKMCHDKLTTYYNWFIHDTIVEMKVIINALCSFHQIWNKILKEDQSSSHVNMY